MKNEEIIKKLSDLPNRSFSLEDFKNELQKVKEEFVKQGNQDEAKQIWIYQTIIGIHILYKGAFDFLKNKEHYKGWCELEQTEIELGFLKKHFQYDKESFYLFRIEKAVKNLQVIFPYRLFSSSEIVIEEENCSVCNQKTSIRKPCGHIVGEIYNGEMCHRIVTKIGAVLGVALVPNPENKFAVLFLTDEKTGEQIDQYNYEAIDSLFNCIENPYEYWDLKVTQRTITKENYDNIGRNDSCACGSGKKFKKCCGLNIGKKYPHYEFIVHNPTNKEKFIANTIKRNINS